MAKYRVERRLTTVSFPTYIVEANSEEEAIELALEADCNGATPDDEPVQYEDAEPWAAELYEEG